MKNEQNAPKIRFKGFTDAWELRKLSLSFDILQNNTLSRSELSIENGAARNVHYGDILVKYGEVLDLKTEELPFIQSSQTVDKLKGSFLQNGDIIMADTAEDETAGKCTEIANLDNMNVLAGLHTIPLRPKQKYAVGYLGYYMNSGSFHDKLLPLMQGTKVTSISKSALQGMSILRPADLEEQRQIGTYFRTLDRLITLHQRKCETLKKLKKSMLQKMFPKNGSHFPEIRFAGFTDAWELRKLSLSFDILQNNTLSRSELSIENGAARNVHYGDILVKYGEVLDLKTEELPFIQSSQTVDKLKGSFLQNGDIIMADTAEDETAGKCTEIANLDNMNVLAGLHTIPLRPKQKYAVGYLGYYMNSGSFHDKLLPLMQGTKVTSISKSALQGMSILRPADLEEQRQIGTYFRTLDRLITLHQRKLETLKKLKKAMLQKMFI